MKKDFSLKKCPFCGGYAELKENESDWTLYSISCLECKTEQPSHLTKDTAIDRWNQRA